VASFGQDLRVFKWNRCGNQAADFIAGSVAKYANWLQVILNVEFGSKAYLASGFANTDELRRIRLLWCSIWRKANHGKAFP
jgi:hypothetical protein